MFDSATLQVLVQSGAIGLCFYLIYVNRKINNGRMEQMLSVMKSNTDAMVANATIIGKFSEKLDELIRR